MERLGGGAGLYFPLAVPSGAKIITVVYILLRTICRIHWLREGISVGRSFNGVMLLLNWPLYSNSKIKMEADILQKCDGGLFLFFSCSSSSSSSGEAGRADSHRERGEGLLSRGVSYDPNRHSGAGERHTLAALSHSASVCTAEAN